MSELYKYVIYMYVEIMKNLLNYINEPQRRVVPNFVVLQVNIVLMIHVCPLMEQCIVLLVYL